MKDKIMSTVTGKEYYAQDVCRILNLRQVAAYLKHHAELLDVYPSIDVKTGNPILVFIFDRSATKSLYDKWCKHELN